MCIRTDRRGTQALCKGAAPYLLQHPAHVHPHLLQLCISDHAACFCAGAGTMDSDSDDLDVRILPEASGSDVTDSDDDSDSSEGRWVMYKSPAKGKEAADPMPNGQKHKRKQRKADDPQADSMISGKVSRQKKKTKASESEPEAGASQPEMKAAKKREVAGKDNDEPITISEAPVKPKKSKKKHSAAEDVFAPAEEYEDMLHEDAPLQTASKGSKGRTRAKVQSKGSKPQGHADTDEPYEWD